MKKEVSVEIVYRPIGFTLYTLEQVGSRVPILKDLEFEDIKVNPELHSLTGSDYGENVFMGHRGEVGYRKDFVYPNPEPARLKDMAKRGLLIAKALAGNDVPYRKEIAVLVYPNGGFERSGTKSFSQYTENVMGLGRLLFPEDLEGHPIESEGHATIILRSMWDCNGELCID